MLIQFNTPPENEFLRQMGIIDLMDTTHLPSAVNPIELGKKIFYKYKTLLGSNNKVVPQAIIAEMKENNMQWHKLFNNSIEVAEQFMQVHIDNLPIEDRTFIRETDSSKTINFIQSLDCDWYNASQVAEYLKKTTRTISNWSKTGIIKKEKEVGQKVYSKKELIRLYRIYI
jgi:hypothetical protein